MNKSWLVAVVATLAACSGGTSPGDGAASGTAGQGGSAGAGAGGGPMGGNGSAGKAGEAAAGGASGGAGAGMGSGGKLTSGGAGAGGAAAGSAGAAGGPPMIPDDAGSGACHDYTPCGGDIVGSWQIDVCMDPPWTGLKTFCPAATETSSVTGTADVRADGTMTTTLRVAFETTLPASCVAELGPCGEAGQGLNLLEDCMPGAAGSCVCESVTEPEPSDATYTTTPEGLMTVVREGEPSYTYYCRQGEEFWARGVDVTNGHISVLHFTRP